MSWDVDDRPLKTTIAVLASLRFVGPDVDPSLVTTKLRIAPTRSTEVGQPVRGSPEHRYRNGAWVLHSELPETSSVAEHIEHLLDKVRDKGDALRWLSRRGWPGEFFCSYWLNHGPEIETAEDLSAGDGRSGVQLKPELLSRMASLGLGIIVDVNSSEESPDESDDRTESRSIAR